MIVNYFNVCNILAFKRKYYNLRGYLFLTSKVTLVRPLVCRKARLAACFSNLEGQKQSDLQGFTKPSGLLFLTPKVARLLPENIFPYLFNIKIINTLNIFNKFIFAGKIIKYRFSVTSYSTCPINSFALEYFQS